MNFVFEGSISTMPVLLEMKHLPITLIRPLALCCESDIQTYAAQQQYLKQKKQCPHEHQTNRTAIANLFQALEQLNPEVRYSMWHALEKAGKLTEKI